MPLPKTKDVGKVMKVLNKEKPGMSRKQKIAISLSQTGKSKKIAEYKRRAENA